MQVGTLIRITYSGVIGVVIAPADDIGDSKDRWVIYGLTNNKKYEMGSDNPSLEIICK